MKDAGEEPDPGLYPELAAEDGSLVAALRATCHRLGVELPGLGETYPPEGLSSHFAAALKTEFGDVRLELRPEHREVAVTISMPLVGVAGSGATASLESAVRIAEAWRAGIPLADMTAQWGFLTVSPEALAHDQGKAVEYEWARVRALSPGLIDLDLVEAAYATPELRALFPMVAHGSLQFRRRTIAAPGSDIPSLFPAWGGGWLVTGLPGPGPARRTADTAGEAVGIVVAGLPEGCGPAVEVIHAARHGA
ncbi:DUF6193 family natural product biosynthesis protein [Streptomyces sp. NPDC101118]|uniref:DUF6193 family natural product biosynthesis protein n=1 Tax=Streptomyces sp. NPDC101118 TaxID=3366109 RepID=UPI00380D6A2E